MRGRAAARPALLLAAALLGAVAFPPWNLTVCAWFALTPLLLALRGLSPGRAACAGLAYGVLTIWAQAYWVPWGIAHYYDQSLAFGILFSLAVSVIFYGIDTAGFAACYALLPGRWSAPARILSTAALWVSFEMARAHLLTGNPWLMLGYALLPWIRFAQAADLGGVYLLSFVVAAAAAAIAEAWPGRAAPSRRRGAGLAVAASLIAFLGIYGTIREASPPNTEPKVDVAVVQGDQNLGRRWSDELRGQGFEHYRELTRKAALQTPPDLVIWPESAITIFLAHTPSYRRVLADLFASMGSDAIVGGPHYEGPRRGPEHQPYNSAFYFDAARGLRGRYDKVHLLPFAEYYPLQTLGLVRRDFGDLPQFTPGSGPRDLDTRLGRIAVSICFEAIFPNEVRTQMVGGARLLVNLSNDAWLGEGAGPEQHLSMVRLRAIENRTWVVRSTTTGISALIDPWGRLTAQAGLGEATVLRGDVVLQAEPTLYKRIGDLFAWCCILFAAAALILTRRRPTSGPGNPRESVVDQ